MGVVRSRRQRLISGIVAALALAVGGEAWAQRADTDPQNCERGYPLRGGVGNVSAGSSASLDAGLRLLESAEQSLRRQDFDAARAVCREQMGGSRGQARNIRAYTCVGRALLGMSRLSDGTLRDVEQAHCALHAAAHMASHRAVTPEARGEAYQGHAEVLVEMSRRRPDLASQFRTLAMTRYENAIGAEPNVTASSPLADRNRVASRHFALGRLYLAAGDSRAESAITNGRNLAPEGPATARALIEFVESPGRANANNRQYLDWAVAAHRSMTTHSALGVHLYNAGDYPGARTQFGHARSLASATGDIATNRNYRADAFYYLSVLSARDLLGAANLSAAEWDRVYDDAQQAVQAGGSEFRHRRQICLAHIVRGGAAVRDDTNALACELGNTPEAHLLRGMYELRRAQYLNPDNMIAGAPRDRWLDSIRRAGRAFTQGIEEFNRLSPEEQRRLLPDDASPSYNPPASDERLTWPTYPASNPPFHLLYMLRFGRDIVATQCPLPRGTPVPPVTEEEALRASAQPYYRTYQLTTCVSRVPR